MTQSLSLKVQSEYHKPIRIYNNRRANFSARRLSYYIKMKFCQTLSIIYRPRCNVAISTILAPVSSSKTYKSPVGDKLSTLPAL